jgi:hypothetical protein
MVTIAGWVIYLTDEIFQAIALRQQTYNKNIRKFLPAFVSHTCLLFPPRGLIDPQISVPTAKRWSAPVPNRHQHIASRHGRTHEEERCSMYRRRLILTDGPLPYVYHC